MEIDYPKSHIRKIATLDSLSTLIGLAILAWPFVTHTFPGSGDTTAHVALGGLIAVAAIFRVLLAYGSLWLEIPLFSMGLIAATLPYIQNMRWNHPYSTFHLAAGIALCLLATLSAALTVPVLRNQPTSEPRP